MNISLPKSVALKNGPTGVVTTVRTTLDGCLVVDCYDFSEEAHGTFGNDVAFHLKVDPKETRRVLQLLLGEGQPVPAPFVRDARLLDLIASRFTSYFDVLGWMQENGIAFDKTFDPWA
jgi:hypothetical protein